ncbi:META domain-containing protein [Rhodoblastus sp. 17X3]|uniref:META domain-containing protein n=1 Tax=Rhodoblastus sp. 17X3 TaxID=3047026 RepID=UPI0024B64CCE|nr:META domain-containing protein [Rhodoblastus sp. 17X3]MDI9848391.1 META domain-containing protein [Rhodoblastus sp. 17X3]
MVALVALAAAPALADGDALTGKWRVEQVRDGGAFDASKTSFEFLPNGRMAATLGCNRMMGEPAIHGDKISFSQVAGTRMACPPPLDQLEWKFSAALEATRTYRIEGAKLTFADEKNEPLIVFRRAD